MEAELGQRLFHRLGRKVVPTAAGETFLRHARTIRLEVENALREISDVPEAARAHAAIGAIPTVAPHLLPAVIARAHVAMPGVEIDTYEDFQIYLHEAVHEGELDLALTLGTTDDPALVTTPLFEEPLLLVCGTNHRFATQAEIRAADLAGEHLVLLGEKSTLVGQVWRFIGELPSPPVVRHRGAQVETVKSLVAGGLGISILPASARAPMDDGRLVYRQLSGSQPRRTIAIVRHGRRYQTRAARRFIKVLREEAARLPGVRLMPEGAG